MSSFCSAIPPPPQPPPSISSFINNHPPLTLLQNHCSTMNDLKKIHSHMIRTGLHHDTIAANTILAFSALSPHGDINYAYLFFTRMNNPNLYSWNTIIRGFSNSSKPQLAVSILVDMCLCSYLQPQRLTYPSVFKAYGQLGAGKFGSQLHGRVAKLGLENDEFIGNTLIYMYANSGLLSEARRVFDAKKSELDVVSWNSMIMGYAKCGEIDDAWKLFDKMPERNSVTWNSIIGGCVRNGRLAEAMELFRRMQEEEGVEPSEFTMVSLLNACAHLGALRHGEWVHDYVKKNGFEMNVIVVTAIIDMYCKCGSIENAVEVFEAYPSKRGLSCWNSIIIGLAMNGHEREVIEYFSKLETSTLKPDSITFIGVLTACKHLGEVDKAKDYFAIMMNKYEIEPSIKHYTLMVEVLGQASQLQEAEELVRDMPIRPDAIIWGSLLSSCRKHGDVETAKRAAQRVRELNPSDMGGYVLMSNVEAASNRFEEAMEHRTSMKKRSAEKEPGCSSIEVYGEVHEFLAGGRLHPKTKEIYSLLHCVDT